MTVTKACPDGPKCILITMSSTYDWLYKTLIPDMRGRFGTRIVVIGPEAEARRRYAAVSEEGDVFLDDKTLIDGDHTRVLEPDVVFQQTRALEERYKLAFWRDIVQQDRNLSSVFLSNSPYFAMQNTYNIDNLSLANTVNIYFSKIKELIVTHNVDFILSRPDSLLGVPLSAIAEDLNIPVSFPDVVKFQDLIGWSCGAYRGTEHIRKYYDEKDFPNFISDKNMEDPYNYRYADKSFENPDEFSDTRKIAKEFFKLLTIRFIMILSDIRHGKIKKRASFLRQILGYYNKLNSIRALNFLYKKTKKRMEESPFVLFLLPVEPEFNSHSLAREFNNSLAIAQQISLCLPAGYILALKEHGSNIGNRSISYYKNLALLPNVAFVDHRILGTKLADQASLLVTISGTIGIEASLLGKRVITFTDRTVYNFLPHIHVVRSLIELPELIRNALKPMEDQEASEIRGAGIRFYSALQSIGFPAPDSPLFKGENRTLPDASRARALDLLIECWSIQRSSHTISS